MQSHILHYYVQGKDVKITTFSDTNMSVLSCREWL